MIFHSCNFLCHGLLTIYYIALREHKMKCISELESQLQVLDEDIGILQHQRSLAAAAARHEEESSSPPYRDEKRPRGGGASLVIVPASAAAAAAAAAGSSGRNVHIHRMTPDGSALHTLSIEHDRFRDNHMIGDDHRPCECHDDHDRDGHGMCSSLHLPPNPAIKTWGAAQAQGSLLWIEPGPPTAEHKTEVVGPVMDASGGMVVKEGIRGAPPSDNITIGEVEDTGCSGSAVLEASGVSRMKLPRLSHARPGQQDAGPNTAVLSERHAHSLLHPIHESEVDDVQWCVPTSSECANLSAGLAACASQAEIFVAKKRRVLSQFKELEGAYWGCLANNNNGANNADVSEGGILNKSQAGGNQAITGELASIPAAQETVAVPTGRSLQLFGLGKGVEGGCPGGGRLGLFSKVLSSATDYGRMVPLAEVGGLERM